MYTSLFMYKKTYVCIKRPTHRFAWVKWTCANVGLNKKCRMCTCTHPRPVSATCCSTLQHSCNTLQHSATFCNILQHSATLFNTLQLTAHLPQESVHSHWSSSRECHTLQHTATQLQHSCNTAATHCAISQHSAYSHWSSSCECWSQ